MSTFYYMIESQCLGEREARYVPIGVWVTDLKRVYCGFLSGNDDREKAAVVQAEKVTAPPLEFFEYLQEQSNAYLRVFSEILLFSGVESVSECVKTLLRKIENS
jgi:hypothetical protein